MIKGPHGNVELQAASKSAPRFPTRLRMCGTFLSTNLQANEGSYGLLLYKKFADCLPGPTRSSQNLPCRRPSATPPAGCLDLPLDSTFLIPPNLHTAQHTILAKVLTRLNTMDLIRSSLAGVQKSLLSQGSTSDGQISQFLKRSTRTSKQHPRRSQEFLLRSRK